MAVRLDGYARKVVGWATSPPVDAAVVPEAWRMAVGRRQPAAGLLPHADRGSQYACQAYHQLRAAHGICCRRSAQGECRDNAVAERCFGSLTGERTALRHDATRQEARADVVDDIEMFSNRTRLHASLGYVSPNDYEGWAKVAELSVRFPLTTSVPSKARL